jgi:hypothetical protein
MWMSYKSVHVKACCYVLLYVGMDMAEPQPNMARLRKVGEKKVSTFQFSDLFSKKGF